MIDTQNFVIYRSSAGSGKTYTLAKEYLMLALKSDFNFRHILAVTFTNKATQEMKERILENLKEIAEGEEKIQGLAKEIGESLGLNAMELRRRANRVLTNILHNYSNFHIKTIDSFFQEIIKSFIKELEMEGAPQVEMDQVKVMEEVTDELIDSIGENKNLNKWLIKFAEKGLEDGKSWDPSEAIGKFSNELLKESFKSIEQEIQSLEYDDLKEFSKQLNGTINSFKKQTVQLGKQALSILKDAGIDVEEFSYGKASFASFFLILASGKVAKPGTRFIKAQDNVNVWVSKKSALKDQAEKAYYGGLNDLIGEILEFFRVEHPRYLSALHTQRYLYCFGIIKNIASTLEKYRKDNNLMLISDATNFLKQIIGKNDTPFVYEKIGNKFNHYLIDEFQDTSGFQWDNFFPLIENTISQGYVENDEIEPYKNLIVGDVKQSIYRWRGGDLRLLQEGVEKDIGQHLVKIQNLDTNWRSRKNVINFNNAIFRGMSTLFASQFKFDLPPEAEPSLVSHITSELEILENAYQDVFQKFPEHKETDEKKGYVNLTFIKEQKGVSTKDLILEKLPHTIEELQAKGYKASDIAFLTRNKADGVKLASYFMDYKNTPLAKEDCCYEVVSSESLYLGKSSLVRVIIAAIRVLHTFNPETSEAAREKYDLQIKSLDYEYSTYLLNVERDFSYEFMNKEVSPKIQDLLSKASSYTSVTLYEMIESIIQTFDLNEIQDELAYLQSFQDLVMNFTLDESDDLGTFLSWWDQKGKTTSVQMSDSLNAMTVLTIHKSKGLQYPVVIIPFCDWKVDHNTTFDNILWLEGTEEPFNTFKRFPLKYTKELSETFYARSYYEEKIKAALDNINLLYVAYTRAEQCLYSFSPIPKAPPKGTDTFKSVHDMLYAMISSPTFSSTESDWNFNENEEESCFEINHLETAELSSKSNKKAVGLKSYHSLDWRKRFKLRETSESIFYYDSENKLSKIDEGILVHDILSEIKTKEDIEITLDQFYERGALSKEKKGQIRDVISKIVSHPVVSDWFTDNWEIRTEVPILPKNRGRISRLDRVIIKGKQAIILDYKTGLKNKKDIKQLHVYKKLLLDMGYDTVEAYLLYLETMDLVKVG